VAETSEPSARSSMAVQEHVDAMVANVKREVARVSRDSLAPVVVVDELPATAGVGDGGCFATGDAW
jgi:hypothetical protein